MLNDAKGFRRIIIACGKTDYPRRIIILADFRETLQLNIPFEYFSNNDYSFILVVQTTMRRYCHNATTVSFI